MQALDGRHLPITREQADNLFRLAIYHLREIQESLMQFSMAAYATELVDGQRQSVRLCNRECGTAGCLIGHGPQAGVFVHPMDRTWGGYGRRAFGSDESEVWDWLFSTWWRYTDDTPRGAALRVLWYLAHGAPRDAEQQLRGSLNGSQPLCYQGWSPDWAAFRQAGYAVPEDLLAVGC